MLIVSKEDKYIATTWGAAIRLKAGEPREVGKDLALLCLQEGCEEYIEPKAEEQPVVVKTAPTKKKTK